MQDLDVLRHVFLICAEFEAKTSVSSFYKEKNFKPCLTKQLLNMFKLWCERGIRQADVEGSNVLLHARQRGISPCFYHRRAEIGTGVFS